MLCVVAVVLTFIPGTCAKAESVGGVDLDALEKLELIKEPEGNSIVATNYEYEVSDDDYNGMTFSGMILKLTDTNGNSFELDRDENSQEWYTLFEYKKELKADASQVNVQKAGTYEVIFTLRDCKVAVPIYVTEPLIDSVEILTMPDKVTYYQGEKIDVRGMKYRINYVDGTSFIDVVDEEDRSSVYYDNLWNECHFIDWKNEINGKAEIGQNKILGRTLSYQFEIPVTVKESTIKSIVCDKAPSRFVRESFWDGGWCLYNSEFTIEFKDGTTEKIKIDEHVDTYIFEKNGMKYEIEGESDEKSLVHISIMDQCVDVYEDEINVYYYEEDKLEKIDENSVHFLRFNSKNISKAFSFTPKDSGKYNFYAENARGPGYTETPYCYLLDEAGNIIKSERGFDIECELLKDNVYIFVATLAHNDTSGEQTYRVYLKNEEGFTIKEENIKSFSIKGHNFEWYSDDGFSREIRLTGLTYEIEFKNGSKIEETIVYAEYYDAASNSRDEFMVLGMPMSFRWKEEENCYGSWDDNRYPSNVETNRIIVTYAGYTVEIAPRLVESESSPIVESESSPIESIEIMNNPWKDFKATSKTTSSQILSQIMGLQLKINCRNGKSLTHVYKKKYESCDWDEDDTSEGILATYDEGSRKVYIEYMGAMDSIDIDLEEGEQTIKKLEIVKEPDRTAYYVQRDNNLSYYWYEGLVLGITDLDGKYQEVEAYSDEWMDIISYDDSFDQSTYEVNLKKVGEYMAYIVYKGLRVEIPITVLESPIESIVCVKNPKTFVRENKTNLYGGKFTILYKDGTSEEIEIKEHTDTVTLEKDHIKYEFYASTTSSNEVLRVFASNKYVDFRWETYCYEKEKITDIKENEVTSVTINQENLYRAFQFTPEKDGIYKFYSLDSKNTCAFLCDIEGNILQENYTYGENFELECRLEGTKTYVFVATYYNVSSFQTGEKSYNCILEKVGGTEVSLSNIELKKAPEKKEYLDIYDGASHIVENIDLYGAVITLSYSDGNQKDITVTEHGATYSIDEDYKIDSELSENQLVLKCDAYSAKTEINRTKLDISNIVLENQTVTYDGKSHSITAINVPSDVTVVYEGNEKTEVGTYTVKAKFGVNGNFELIPEKAATLKIVAEETAKKNISECSIALSKNIFTYDGKAKKPTVKVGNLTSNDYTISYKNNVKPGVATVTVTGKNQYQGSLSATFTIVLKTGYSYTYKNLKYKVLNGAANGKGTVAVTGYTTKKAKLKKVTIPDTVTILGVKYKVTVIDKNAFKGCTKIASLTLGSNVVKIGNNAFEKCTSLTKVTIPAKVTTIGISAFKSCKKLKTVVFKSKVLKSVGKNTFNGIYSKATIKVPTNKLKEYKKLIANKGQGKKVKIVK